MAARPLFTSSLISGVRTTGMMNDLSIRISYCYCVVWLTAVFTKRNGDHLTALSGWEVGVESNLLPGVQFQKLRVRLGLYAFVRIASESKAEGRFIRLDRLDDGL